MAGSPRPGTAQWHPTGPKTRPFRFGVQATSDSDPPLAPGTILEGRYRVDRLLGEGGMGRVYLAEHLRVRRQVALKLLRRDRQHDAKAVARFRQEAQSASRIGHPAIVEMIDFARTEDGSVFLVMELLQGETLEDWMMRPNDFGMALPWLVEVAHALDAAHRAGVVHRDVKPGNIFLHRDGRGSIQPKILDFGIAKLLDAERRDVETEAGTLLGTPYYLAPERALNRPLGPQSDLYGFGVILYELVTGTVPFVDDSFMAILALHVKAPPLDPRQAAPQRGIPDGVAALIMGLLAKEPRDRPSSGADVGARLQQLMAAEGEVLGALRTGPQDHADKDAATMQLQEVSGRVTAMTDVAGDSDVLHAEGARRSVRSTPGMRGMWLLLVAVMLGLGIAGARWLRTESSISSVSEAQLEAGEPAMPELASSPPPVMPSRITDAPTDGAVGAGTAATEIRGTETAEPRVRSAGRRRPHPARKHRDEPSKDPPTANGRRDPVGTGTGGPPAKSPATHAPRPPLPTIKQDVYP